MNVLVSLNSAVQSQGIKVDARDWLDMGSETWSKTPDKVKAAAYQAAMVAGWQDEGLRQVLIKCWGPRVDDDAASFTLQTLKELAQAHPLEVEEVYKDENPAPVFKIAGCDRTIPFPPNK